MKLFVDTWGWVVLKDPSEPRHVAAVRLLQPEQATAGRIITSDYVLDEALTLLFSRRPFDEAWRFTQTLMESVAQGLVTVERVTETRFHKSLDLRKKLADKPKISFTDLTSMVIMSELKIEEVLTGDAHFRQVGMGFRVLPE